MTALLRKSIEIFFNRLFSPILLIMATQHWPSSLMCEKYEFLNHFDRIYHTWKFQHDSETFKKFAPWGRRRAPLQVGRASHSGSSERTNFSKFQNHVETFRSDKFDQNEQENYIFSRIEDLHKCWEAILSEIGEKSLVEKKSMHLRRSAVVSRIFVRFSWNFTHWLQIGCTLSSSSRETIRWIFQKLFDIE